MFSTVWPRIFVSGIPVKKNEDGTEEVFPLQSRSGRIIVVTPRYIITSNHIVDLSFFSMPRRTPFGMRMDEMKADEVRNERFWLQVSYNSPELLLNKVAMLPDIDGAVFELADTAFVLKPNLPLGRSRDLCLGHTVFIIGSPAMLGTHIRESVISAFHFIPQSLVDKKVFGPLDVNLLITISANIDLGDSGSPIIALRDGVPEIVGVISNVFAVGGLMHGFSMIVPIDEIIKRMRESTGIDLKSLSDEYFYK